MSPEFSFDADVVEWLCPICQNPMPACAPDGPCTLNDLCCADCFARCQAAERCAMIQEESFWIKLEAQLAKIGTFPH
jgi:hypothetical protein